MSQENRDRFLASLTFEVVQANDEATILHSAGVRVASLQRDPDQDGVLFLVDLDEAVPAEEEIVGWQGYQLNDPALPINATVRRVTETQRSILVVDGSGNFAGIDFHLDLTFYRKHEEVA